MEQALRLGYLQPGDQLPKVREVVAALAINPNTVLKAYRDLEQKGLTTGRPGQGTFIDGSLKPATLPELAELRRSLFTWLEEADAAGLDEQGVVSLVTSTLGRRFGSTWALRDCTLTIPEAHLVAVVGPNGAGKSTLLNLVVGLSRPTAGRVSVLGGHAAGSLAALDGIAFVAQDTAVYRHLSVGDMLHLTRNLNLHFDLALARARLDELGIYGNQKVGKLSGGQQAQLALTLALARHPRLLVLGEPTASLDPLARHDFMAAVMTAMADDGVSVVLCSHMLAELERVADYLVLISQGRVRLNGTVDDLLAGHRLVTGPAGAPPGPGDWEVIESSAAGAQLHQVVRLGAVRAPLPPAFQARTVGIEELNLAYLRGNAPHASAPTLTGAPR